MIQSKCLDLPKLTSITTTGWNSLAFKNPRYITLESDYQLK